MIAVLNAVASVMDAYMDAQVAAVGAFAAKGAKVLEAATAAVDEINAAVKASDLGATMQRAKQIQAEYMAAAAPHIEAVTAAAAPFEASVKRLQQTWAGVTGEADKAAPNSVDFDGILPRMRTMVEEAAALDSGLFKDASDLFVAIVNHHDDTGRLGENDLADLEAMERRVAEFKAQAA